MDRDSPSRRRAANPWTTHVDEPTRTAAHHVHHRKEAMFIRFFSRNRLGRWISRYTTANQWSMARFPLAGILLWTLLTHHFPVAFLVAVLIGFSDLIDGPLARFQGTAGPEGRRLESLADSVCIIVAFIALSVLTRPVEQKILFGLAAILEFVRLGGVVYYENRVDLEALEPNQSGKWKFVFYVAATLAWISAVVFQLGTLRGLTDLLAAIGVYLSLHSLVRHRIELEALPPKRPQPRR